MRGNDILDGGDGDDDLRGGEGDDILRGGFGNNWLRGGPGDDTLIGESSFQNSRIDFNRIDYADAEDAVRVVLSFDTGGLEQSFAESRFFDAEVGDDLANIGIDSLVQTEFIRGSQFNDIVTVAGNYANRGGAFVEFEGGPGDDTFSYNGSTDQGRVGYREAEAGVTVNLQAGTAESTDPNPGDDDAANIGVDTFSGVGRVRGSDFDDILIGRNTTRFDEFRPRDGNDAVDGGTGLADRVRYSAANQSVIVDLGSDNQTTQITVDNDGWGNTGDTLIRIEEVRGGAFNDELRGDVNDNILIGDDGDDLLAGRGGDDDLRGGAGDDLLIGGGGSDVIEGGIGFNRYRGGAGNDVFVGPNTVDNDRVDGNRAEYHTSDVTGAVTVTLSDSSTVTGDASVGTDFLTNIERVRGSNFDDTFTVDATFSGIYGTFNELEGRGGDDTFIGNGATRLRFTGANGGVEASLTGEPDIGFDDGYAIGWSASADGAATNIGVDTILSGVDALRGSGFGDFLTGDAGNNLLRGEGGGDVLYGLAGDDFIQISDATFLEIDGGLGQDTIYLRGAFDLNTIFGAPVGDVFSIERINLNDTDANELTLAAGDVFDLSETINTDLTSAMAAQLAPGTDVSTSENAVISGATGDTVNLFSLIPGEQWNNTGQDVTLSDGQSYSVFNYVSGSSVLATVAVDNEVVTTLNVTS